MRLPTLAASILLLLAASAGLAQQVPDTPGFRDLPVKDPVGHYGRWEVQVRVDPMTDEVSYMVLGPGYEIAASPTRYRNRPLHLRATEHDFPGKTMAVRIDGNPQIDIEQGIFFAASSEVLRQMLTGKRMLVAYYHWPYDRREIREVDLDGFADAWTAAASMVLVDKAWPEKEGKR